MKRIVLLMAMALSVVVARAQTEIGVDVHKVVSQNETFNVTFTVEGGNQADDFAWAPGDGFELIYGPSRGRSVSTRTINGKTTTSAKSTFTYALRALTPGKYTIPAASAMVGSKKIYSTPVDVEVVASSSSSAASASSSRQSGSQRAKDNSKSLMLKIAVDRTDVVVGEPVTVTFRLYSRVSVISFDGFYPPSFTGFKAQELSSSGNIDFSREVYEGEIYEVADIIRYRLFPQQQGRLSISPAELICVVSDRMGFHHYRTMSQEVVINVSELPKGEPEFFGDGIGKFTMSARLASDSMKSHEVGSLFVTVSGEGNVAFLEAPKVSFPPDMEVYDVKSEEKLSQSGLAGSKTFEYPFIPRSHGDFVIGPIEYSYYDTSAGKYVTITAPAMTLKVEKGMEQSSSGPVMVSGVMRKDVENLGSDIRFINMNDHGLAEKGSFFVLSLPFWILTVLIVMIGFVVWFVLRKVMARRKDVVGAKKRKATKMAFKRLRQAEIFLKQNLYSAFYEELHKALLGYVADKLNMPLSSLSRENISEALSTRGVPAEQVDQFVGLLDACEFARYAPDSGTEAMSAHYDDALDVISSIDSNLKTVKNMKKVYVGAVLMFLSFSASAQSAADSLWSAANNAYLDGNWQAAAQTYEKIAETGLESAALYCNTGNAYFKSGSVPKAILNYERALKLDPSYEDARHNLELLNSQIQDKMESIPEFFLTSWMKSLGRLMSSNAWAVMFLVFLLLTVSLALFFVFARTSAGRITGFSVGLLTLLVAIFSLSFSIWQKNEYLADDSAIVMAPVVTAKSSPSADANQELFVLHEGTKVKVIERVGEWSNIELSDGRQGWVPAGELEII